MIKTISEKVVKEVDDPIAKEYYCDFCGKLLGRRAVKDYKSYRHNTVVDYYLITTGHHDWGNDSGDSISNKDCCPRCLYSAFNKYVSESKGRRNTEYLDIQHDYFMGEDEE